MAKIKVDVLGPHIINGDRDSYSNHPIALAVRNVCPTDNVEVGEDLNELCFNFKYIKLPRKVSKWNRDLNLGKDVRPFSFKIDLHPRKISLLTWYSIFLSYLCIAIVWSGISHKRDLFLVIANAIVALAQLLAVWAREKREIKNENQQ